MSHKRVLEEVRDYDIIGISSIFTPQTSMVIETIKLIKQEYPNKLVISGVLMLGIPVKNFSMQGLILSAFLRQGDNR